ncbi:cytochrome P450 family protein [Sinosporangium siamense]|uniref:Cytochrome P450 hydroxylase n=1 Tax=Sinosporangium siamense TaxID=1367973 RepID=A0A919RDG8_9ACTN|nr:cytochrome P450 [Sinosporangium siamense]GII90755.1 cytochrome P450 hydroxylase [Sinosporangium siamense]
MSVPNGTIPDPVPDSVRDMLWSREFQNNPYPAYDLLRADASVHRVPTPLGVDMWVITRYDDVRLALSDPRFTKDPRNAPDILRKLGVETEGEGLTGRNMLNSDPPEHTRLRGVVTKAFTRRRVEALRPRIQEITDGLLGDLSTTDEVDVIAAFAFPLPVIVICELMGVPADRRDEFREWSIAVTTPPHDEESKQTRKAGTRALHGFFRDLVERRRPLLDRSVAADAQPDLVSALIVASEEEGRLDLDELIGTLTLMLVAGHETTVNLIGNGLLALMRHPGQQSLLRERPELLPGAIEELLRYDGPVERATMRVAVEDVELGGTVIPRGALISVAIGAADRDGSRFPGADVLDVTRRDNQHLASGHGVHYCAGAPLARLEGEIAFGALLRRFAVIEPACPIEELAWRPGVGSVLRGLLSLPVRLTAS